jgi:hypothetical protein
MADLLEDGDRRDACPTLASHNQRRYLPHGSGQDGQLSFGRFREVLQQLQADALVFSG